MAIDVAEILGVQGRQTVVSKHLATHPIHMRKTIAELDAAGMSAAADTLIWAYWHYKLKETNLDDERKDAGEMRNEVARLRAELDALRPLVSDAQDVIARGVELMPLDQVSQWSGVRAWQEAASAAKAGEG